MNNFWLFQQNKIEPCSGVPLHDRGFRYGQHIFETVAIRNGKNLFFQEHWDRLILAAKKYSFPVNASWHQVSMDFLKTEVWSDGLLRIFLTAGEGAPLAAITKPQLFFLWEETNFPSEEKLKIGINVVSLDQPMGSISWGEKNGNYWNHLMGLERAHQADAEEGLVFDQDSFLISATMANVILWMKDGKIITPPRARGARDGVMLAWAREQLPDLREADISRDQLKDVVEMAMTNSRLGVMPIAELDGQKLLQERSFFLAERYLKNFL